jgi:hypothetical protein
MVVCWHKDVDFDRDREVIEETSTKINISDYVLNTAYCSRYGRNPCETNSVGWVKERSDEPTLINGGFVASSLIHPAGFIYLSFKRLTLVIA